MSVSLPDLGFPPTVGMNKSRMLDCIVLQCGYHYLSMFLTIHQPPELTRHVDLNADPIWWLILMGLLKLFYELYWVLWGTVLQHPLKC